MQRRIGGGVVSYRLGKVSTSEVVKGVADTVVEEQKIIRTQRMKDWRQRSGLKALAIRGLAEVVAGRR